MDVNLPFDEDGITSATPHAAAAATAAPTTDGHRAGAATHGGQDPTGWDRTDEIVEEILAYPPPVPAVTM